MALRSEIDAEILAGERKAAAQKSTTQQPSTLDMTMVARRWEQIMLGEDATRGTPGVPPEATVEPPAGDLFSTAGRLDLSPQEGTAHVGTNGWGMETVRARRAGEMRRVAMASEDVLQDMQDGQQWEQQDVAQVQDGTAPQGGTAP